MAAPVDKITVGNVTLSVFENTVGKGKEAFTSQSVTIQKNYKGKDGKWASSSSFKDSELMYVIMACQERLRKKYFRDNQVTEVTFDEEN